MPSIWFDSHDAQSVAKRIDRYEGAKQHRMLGTIQLDKCLTKLTGGLIIVKGHGKYLDVCSWTLDSLSLPEALTQSLTNTIHSEPSLKEFSEVKTELVPYLDSLVHSIKAMAGKYVDHLFAVSITDPGIWQVDFEGNPIFHSFCDAEKLANLCGLNVISSFPAKSLAANGSGQWLDALPSWLFLADRNARQAQFSRAVWRTDPEPQVYFLPGSDGLDSDLPKVKILPAQCTDPPSIIAWLKKSASDLPLDRIQWVSAQSTPGRRDSEITVMLEREFDQLNIAQDIDGPSYDAIMTGILGFLAIDQLPSTLPWLSGCDKPQIVGNIAPGRPTMWRKLLVEMADYRPPAMKLRDAV